MIHESFWQSRGTAVYNGQLNPKNQRQDLFYPDSYKRLRIEYI